MAQPFDAGRMEFAGDAVPIAEQVGSGGPGNGAFFSASATGALAYRIGSAGGAGNLRLTRFDRQGKILDAAEPIAASSSAVAFSPDGSQAAFTRADLRGGNQDIWLYEFARSTATRFTSDPSLETAPVYSPDGKQIVFASERDGARSLYRKPSSNAVPEELLYKMNEAIIPNDWSPDGRFLLIQSVGAKTGPDILYLPMTSPKGTSAKPEVYIQTPFQEGQARFSPDMHFVAYSSDSSGTIEVYVQSFPNPEGERKQVSKGGGQFPHWRRDGKELFYLVGGGGAGGTAMGVDVTLGPSLKIGIPKVLFKVPPGPGPFDVTADGQKFLKLTQAYATSDVSPTPITIVLNWQTGLRK